jgi:hypothetical protein
MSDRDVKSLEKIEVIDLKKKPKLAFIGVGSGDTDLITMEAVTAMSKADAFICPPDIKKRFGKYMGAIGKRKRIFFLCFWVPAWMRLLKRKGTKSGFRS